MPNTTANKINLFLSVDPSVLIWIFNIFYSLGQKKSTKKEKKKNQSFVPYYSSFLKDQHSQSKQKSGWALKWPLQYHFLLVKFFLLTSILDNQDTWSVGL